MIYADFEAITEGGGPTQSDSESYTSAYQKHTDCGYGYKLVCCYDDKYSKPVETYRGKGAVGRFMKHISEQPTKRRFRAHRQGVQGCTA